MGNPDAPLLEVRDLEVTFAAARGRLEAIRGVDLMVQSGETLGLVGESGCGKTTVGRMLLRLVEPTAGRVEFLGDDMTALSPSALRARRRDIQIVFQDPYGSLSPRMPVGDIVGEGLKIHFRQLSPAERDRKVAQALEEVGLDPGTRNRYPHEFSGGQRQRVGIARALALRPRLIVGDEPLSALDVSIQAQIMNLLGRLKRELGLTYILISHNLGVVSHICDRVAVMYLGRVVETAPREALFFDPKHPYTEALLAAVPVARPGRPRRRAAAQGEIPSALNPPSGCPFHPRCPLAIDRCKVEVPACRTVDGREVACHLADTRA